MTAPALADRLGARPAGHGRWQARCPAHDDRTPSLAIAEGDGGRVLVHCRAGCPTAAVLTAAGLTWSDISGTPTSPADRARLRAERERRDAAEVDGRRRADGLAAAAGAVLDRAARLVARLAAIEFAGAAPSYAGEADALAADYHAALDRLRALEAAV